MKIVNGIFYRPVWRYGHRCVIGDIQVWVCLPGEFYVEVRASYMRIIVREGHEGKLRVVCIVGYCGGTYGMDVTWIYGVTV